MKIYLLWISLYKSILKINKIIGYNKKVHTSKLLLEGKAGKFNGMKLEDISKLREKDKDLMDINKKIKEATNIFNKIELQKTRTKLQLKFDGVEDEKKIINKYKKFNSR